MPLPESDFYKQRATTKFETEIFVIGAVVWLILLLVLFFTDNFWCDCVYKFFSKKNQALAVDRKGARKVASIPKPAPAYSRVPKAPTVVAPTREDKTQAATNVSLSSQTTQRSTVAAVPLGQPGPPPSLPLAGTETSGSMSAKVTQQASAATAPTAPASSVAKAVADASTQCSTVGKKDVTASTPPAPATGASTASVKDLPVTQPPP